MLSPLLYSLFTHDCTTRHNSNTIIKFADCGLQEKEDRARPHSHRRGCSGAGSELQVPWCPHHQKINKDTKTVLKWAQRNLFPLRRLNTFVMGPQIIKRFYNCTIESILTGCITAWYGNCSASARKALQRVVRLAQYITGAKLPDIQDLYTRWCHTVG